MSIPASSEIPELKSKILGLLDRLPPRDFSQPVSTELEFYGASRVIAESIGIERPPYSLGTWSHGYHREETPAILISHEQRKDQVNLVRCERHADILRQAGFPYAIAVGMPYLYALKHSTQQVPIIPGSLLFMPAHTLSNLKEESDEESYLIELLKHRHHFSQIVACLHPDCIENGYWNQRLESAGIPWVVGAVNTDANSLRRMHALFSSFEYMATTGLGSHVAYAAATGCKVSFIGEVFSILRRESLMENPFYRDHPEAIEYILEHNKPEDIRKEYAQFFTEPQNAIDQIEWGLDAVGEPAQRSPEEIARLLGWSWNDSQIFKNTRFEKLAPDIGFDPNHDLSLQQQTLEINALKGRVEWLEDKRAALKLEARQNSKRANKAEQKLERNQASYQQIRRSIIWKLARPFHSIEKRLRKIK